MPISTSSPSSFSSNTTTKEIAFKTVPSASKPEIKHFLQTFYGLDVQKVRTLNIKSKKKAYKKVYATLNKPLPFHSDIYPSTAIKEEEEYQQNKKKVLTLHS
ncbi:hypothetical protein RIF29_42304 [Crotalaria pallida]|uniref:Ribosomal protein L23 n=1 Tax=Crotalaria pallida TaxID=3830 RepID=A0AAN9E7W2_CROPI